MLPFLLTGRVAIWTAQTTPLLDAARKRPLLNSLLDCDFCTGFWVYTALHLVFGMNMWGLPHKRVLTAIANGLISSFVMHVLRIGWETRFHD